MPGVGRPAGSRGKRGEAGAGRGPSTLGAGAALESRRRDLRALGTEEPKSHRPSQAERDCSMRGVGLHRKTAVAGRRAGVGRGGPLPV